MALALPRAVAAEAASTTVAPTVQSGPGNIVTRVQDTYITNIDDQDHSSGTALRIGTPDDGRAKYRSLVQFDVSKLAGATIESASLRLYNSDTGSCAGWWMYASPITAAWNQTKATWANQPAVNPDTALSAAANFGIGNEGAGCPTKASAR